MTRPRIASSPEYAASCRSKARHAAPIDRAAQSVMRAGSARITPTTDSMPILVGRRWRSSVRLVEVAALQQVEVAVIVLDVEVQLQVVLDDLGRGVALRPRVVGEGEHDEVRVLAVDRPHSSRI